MIILIRTIIFLAILFPPYGSLLYSQEQDHKADIRFSPGIYIDFDQVRTNEPVPPKRIVSAVDYNDRDFYKNLFTKKSIAFYDDEGTLQTTECDSIWGFSSDGTMNVQVDKKFFPITIVGRISFFSAEIEWKEKTYTNDPDRLYVPYSNYRLSRDAIYDPFARIYYFPYASMYPPRVKEITKSESAQFLLDFDSGTAYEFGPESAADLFRRDTELYREYDRLPMNKKKALIFVYVNRFNERNPLLLPGGKQ